MALTSDARLPASTARWIPLGVAAVDGAVIVAATLLAAFFRVRLPTFESANDLNDNLQTAAVLIVAAWLLTLAAMGAYAPGLFGAGTEEYRAVVNASVVTMAWVGIGCYLTRFPLSRGFYVLLFLVGVPALLISRFVLRRYLQWLRTGGHFAQRVLIAGTTAHVDELSAVFRREAWLGYDVVAALTPEPNGPATPQGIPVVGVVAELAEIVAHHRIDVVFIGGGAFASAEELRTTAWQLEEQRNVQIVVAPHLTEVSSERIRVRPVAGLPLVHLEAPRWRYASAWAKRTFDVVLSLFLLVLTAPLWLILAAWIVATDRGPILFAQTRLGRDAVPFRCLKFRSMVPNAESLVVEVPSDQGDDHVLFKAKKDPRITAAGRFMRRWSVDELPQLLNVLKGEMSLVGPRPPLPSEVERYHAAMHRRLNVRPGMTGLWQVSGRADLTWEETVRLDLYYVDNWSMVQDLGILVRTVAAVLGGRGAY